MNDYHKKEYDRNAREYRNIEIIFSVVLVVLVAIAVVLFDSVLFS